MFCLVGSGIQPLIYRMEDLAKSWKKLSLSEKERDRFDFSKNKKDQNFVLAAKFLTRRSVNVKEVAKRSNRYGALEIVLKSVMLGIIAYCLLLSQMRTLRKSLWGSRGLLIDIW